MPEPVFALIDCNNFFVSCEKVFRPELKNKAVAVLSNNDGCVVARSNEVKALGVPMGAPHFKYENLFRAHKVQTFSANFLLYGDMSQRVVQVLGQFSPHVEVYSVDESFLEIGDLGITDYAGWAKEVARVTEKSTGVPVSVGVASTKTLAKLVTERAKKTPSLLGGDALVDDGHLPEVVQSMKHEEYLRWLPLEDIWGIGRRYAWKLHQMGLRSAYDLTQMPDQWILRHLTIRGLRTVEELRGIACFELEYAGIDEPQKSIASTRSFGHNVRSISELEVAIATFAAKAAARLRRKRELTWEVTTFIRTGYKSNKPLFTSKKLKLNIPSADTSVIIRGAQDALRQAFDEDFAYRKAGVILTDLVPSDHQQMSLVGQPTDDNLRKRDRLMTTIDELNMRFGNYTVKHASEGVNKKQRWHSKRENVSPAYTTDWGQLPIVKV
jgi:DNA polymerase V